MHQNQVLLLRVNLRLLSSQRPVILSIFTSSLKGDKPEGCALFEARMEPVIYSEWNHDEQGW